MTTLHHSEFENQMINKSKNNHLTYMFLYLEKEYNSMREDDIWGRMGMLEAMKSVKHPKYKELKKEFDSKYTIINF